MHIINHSHGCIYGYQSTLVVTIFENMSLSMVQKIMIDWYLTAIYASSPRGPTLKYNSGRTVVTKPTFFLEVA